MAKCVAMARFCILNYLKLNTYDFLNVLSSFFILGRTLRPTFLVVTAAGTVI